MPRAQDRLTLDGYVRVSRVGGRAGASFISPQVQRDQIAGWARSRGVEIAEWHTDLDKSGGTHDRPGLNAVLDRIRTRQTGGIVVAALDRLSRADVPQALRLVEDIHEMGGRVAALDYGLDPTTPFGEFGLTLLLGLARMQRRQTAERWDVARERAVDRGVHVASACPTGYVKRDDGTLEPHPVFGPVIRELFERKAAGASWSELAAFLDSRGVEGPYGQVRWTNRAVAHIISRRVYLGHAYSGEFVNLDAHEPLVDRAVWLAAKEAKGPPKVRGNPGLLAGILRCAGCRYVMKPDWTTASTGERLRMYRCRGKHASGTCESRAAILGRVVEPYVVNLYFDAIASAIARRVAGGPDLGGLERAASAAEAELEAFRDDERIVGALGAERFVAGLRQRAQRADVALRALAQARAEAKLAGDGSVETARDRWPALGVVEQRDLLRGMIDCVFVRSTGRSNVPVEDRTVLLWRGEAPADLPRRGIRPALVPFVWPEGT